MIPLFKVRMSDTCITELNKVLYSGFIGQGEKVEQFEERLQYTLNTKYKPVTTNSCTSAIDLSLEILKIKAGDEVITTPQTCFATNIGLIHRNIIIKWADIDPITGLIDIDSIASLITNKTKAIICVNWAGKYCDYERIRQLNIPIIEDAAHNWDPGYIEWNNRGDFICYSFQAIKYLTCGDGGVVITDKEQEARLLRWYGLDRTKNESFRCTQNIKQAGFKYHMNDIAATIGLENIPEANDSVSKSKNNSKKILLNIHNRNLILPFYDSNCSYWLLSIHIKDNKQKFIDYLNKNKIASSPVHFRNDKYECVKQYYKDNLKGVESFHNTQVCIPNGWWLSESDLDYIINVINDF